MWDEVIGRTILTLRIVLLAIAGGIITFGVLAAVLVRTDAIPAQPKLGATLLPVLLIVVVLMIVVLVLVRLGVRGALRRVQPDDVGPETLIARYRTLNIVSSTLAELPALFGIVVFLLTRQWIALLVPLLALGWLALLFPSRDKYARFAESATGSRDI
jgi:hypothetical protein